MTQAEAHAIITWLMGKTSGKPAQFTKEDCGFAQVLLVEMLKDSFAMGFVEALFRSAAKLPGGPQKAIRSFLKGAGKNLDTYKGTDDLKEMMKKAGDLCGRAETGGPHMQIGLETPRGDRRIDLLTLTMRHRRRS